MDVVKIFRYIILKICMNRLSDCYNNYLVCYPQPEINIYSDPDSDSLKMVLSIDLEVPVKQLDKKSRGESYSFHL